VRAAEADSAPLAELCTGLTLPEPTPASTQVTLFLWAMYKGYMSSTSTCSTPVKHIRLPSSLLPPSSYKRLGDAAPTLLDAFKPGWWWVYLQKPHLI